MSVRDPAFGYPKLAMASRALVIAAPYGNWSGSSAPGRAWW